MSFGRHLRTGLFALLVAVVGVGQAVAQDANATVSGTVADEQGQVLPGATVTLTNEATKLTRSDVSDARGDFRFTNLLPGNYSVKVELQGFKAFERRSNVLNSASTLSIGTIKLSLGQLSEIVEVEASGSTVNVEETQHSGLLTSTQIEQLQSKGRDIVNLLRAIPGVRYGEDTDALGDSFGADVPNINGQRSHWTKATVDGLNASESGGGNKIGSALSLDAISEVKVLLNTYRAEFGGTGGAQIQIVSKSGGTEYRGTLSYFARRTGWNANRWENNKSEVERPDYNYNTFGFNLGGPIPTGGGDKKLFFFINSELPRRRADGALMRFQVPTEAERRGDFSQTFVYGQTVNRVTVRDPRFPGQNVAIPGNIIPAELIDPNMQALMNMYPLPNRTDLSETRGQYNFITQRQNNNPRQNHLLRLDWKPTERDSLFVSGRLHQNLVKGVDTPGSPAQGKWGLYNSVYDFGDMSFNVGHTRVFSQNVVNEFSAGWRNQWEIFDAETDADLARITRGVNGYNRGQFFPQVNSKLNLMPKIIVSNLTSTGVTAPNFDYADRTGESVDDYIFSARDNLTWTKNAHTFKAGVLFERFAQNEGPGGDYMGRFTFDNTGQNNNPYSSTVPFANFLMGTFRTYAEVDQKQDTANRQSRLEWYVQDQWKVNRRLTLDLGVRFSWYQHWYQALDRPPHAAFVPERYSLASAPRQYIDGGGGVAVDPLNRSDVRRPGGSFVGRFVPGSGDPGNGMVLSTDTTYPRGYRDNQGIHPEPSVGLAYDVFGGGKTILHTGFSLRHQSYEQGGYQGNMRGVPAQTRIELPNSTTGLFLASQGFQGPSGVRGIQRDNKTPSSYSMSLGVSQDIGWGTVVDVSYVGVLNRHLDMVRNLNAIPDGAKLPGVTSVQTPVRTINTINPVTGARLPDNELRPYLGLTDIEVHEHWGTANYNALQVQLTRRYIKGLQFSMSYTFSKALGLADGETNDENWTPSRFDLYYAPLAHNQTHNFVTNFTYDFPKIGGPAPVRALVNNWQMSGEYVWASGDWAGVSIDLPSGADLTGGSNCVNLGCDGGANAVMLRNPRKSNGGFTEDNPWFDVDAFAAPTPGNLGNTPRTVIQRPPINSLNVSLFKNFPLSTRRRLQLRLEGYNVLNHTQIRDIGRTLQYDANGVLTNRDTVGLPTGTARSPRILQASVRLSF